MRMTMQILTLGAISLSGACKNAVDVDALQQNVDRHRARWNQAGIVTYRFEFTRICFCAGIEPVTIEVRNGVITSVTNRSTGVELPSDEFTDYVTVQDLFDALEAAINQNVYSIEAMFDQALGYPTRIVIDPGRYVSNDEVTMSTSAVEVV